MVPLIDYTAPGGDYMDFFQYASHKRSAGFGIMQKTNLSLILMAIDYHFS